MTDDPKGIGQIAEAAAAIIPAKEIYKDALQPGVKKVGQAVETVAGTINVALAPLRAMVWGYEKIREYLDAALSERLKYVPPERIVSPNPTVAGPAVEALRFAAHEPNLRELYANLIATSMDASRAQSAHPAFVEILKQLTPDEAKIVGLFENTTSFPCVTVRAETPKQKPTNPFDDDGIGFDVMPHFSLLAEKAGCANPALVLAYTDNLCRLNVMSIPEGMWLSDSSKYVEVEAHKDVIECSKYIDETYPEHRPVLHRGMIRVTTFGAMFIRACVLQLER
jgi:hypothetical protein